MIFRIALEERLAYRGDFALGTLMRFLPIITQIFLWHAVYESVGGTQLAGYTFEDMVAYYLLSMLARAFSSMPGLASSVAKQIRDGEIKKFIVQPIDLIGFMLLGRVAHKVAYYTISTLPFALVFFLCRGYFTSGWPSSEVMLAFLLSCLLAFLLGFFMDLCIGFIGFWSLEVSSLLFIYMLLNFFLSGHMFPLDMLDKPQRPDSGAAIQATQSMARSGEEISEVRAAESSPSAARVTEEAVVETPETGAGVWRTIVDYLPFKYLAYFPAAIFLGKIPADEVWGQIGIEVVWLVGLICLSRLLYTRGLKRYSGYGG